MGYDVFISYSHGDDDLLSERVQDSLTRFAKPWYRRRALNVFRDRTALSANPGLWSSIVEAIDDSRYFLFLASPDAAASVWCGREVAEWRAKHGSENMLILQTDGEILWDEGTNDFNWAATTALGAGFAGAFAEEPFHVDMRWARSETQLDLTDGRFRNQIADLAAPVHGMAKDELASEDVRQHRRAIRLAIGAVAALALLTVAAVATSVFAVKATSRARHEQHVAEFQFIRATKADKLAQAKSALAILKTKEAVASAKLARQQKQIAQNKSVLLAQSIGKLFATNGKLNTANGNLNAANQNLNTANVNLTKGSLALRKSTLLAEARLAARRSEQLMSSGDQTYQLGVLLAAEAVRHACASSAIDPNNPSTTDTYPDPGCAQPGIQIDPSVASAALASISNSGGQFVTDRLAGSTTPYLLSWSANGQRLATFSSAQSSRPDVVQVWNTDGTLAASATSAVGLTPDSALSADGNVLALTTSTSGSTSGGSSAAAARPATSASGSAAVSAWSLGSRQAIGAGRLGRHPSLSANGGVMAWLAPRQAKAIYLAIGGGNPRAIAVPSTPVDVAINPAGSSAAVVVSRGGDKFALIPINVVSGKLGVARDLGSFGTPKGSFWTNPPRVASGESADPPALSFGMSGSTAWVYNNERHVGVQVTNVGSTPTARVAKTRSIPTVLASGGLQALQTSTPDGRTVVLIGQGATFPTYEVWTLSKTGWTTAGLVPIELGAANPCQLSISPNGTELAVSCLSALQIINLQSSASTASAVITNPGAVAHGSSVVVGPTGQTALSWSARSLVMIDSSARSSRPLSVALAGNEVISAVGFDPRGAHFVAVIGRSDGCPCRLVIIDASTGNVVRAVALGATGLDRVPHEAAVGVALDDANDVVAVTFDNNPSSSGAHRCGLATYSVANGKPLYASANDSLGLGEQTVSVPAFLPGTDALALAATQGSAHEVTGVIVDAGTGAVLHTLAMQSGVVAAGGNDSENDRYALAFSPNGELLAWNAGGSVVIWDLAAAGPSVESNVVLTSSSLFDPTALAISNNGEVATVGLNFYGEDAGGRGTAVVLTGDELGRFLQPLGVSRISPTGQPAGQISVAMTDAGAIAAVDLDTNGSRYFTDMWGTSPVALLGELCASSSASLTPSDWQTYFPGETFQPACAGTAENTWNVNASPTAALAAAARRRPARTPLSRPVASHVTRPQLPVTKPPVVKPPVVKPTVVKPTVVKPTVVNVVTRPPAAPPVVTPPSLPVPSLPVPSSPVPSSPTSGAPTAVSAPVP